MKRDELASRLARRVGRDPLARAAREAARQEGVETWLVGGTVRDTALGRPVRDLDLVALRGVARLVRRLEHTWQRRAFRFSKRGVTTWRWDHGGYRVDLVDAARRGIDEDLRRRELTINAVAFDLDRARVYDPLGGLADLRRRCLRLPRPGVLLEDPVRALRAARFLAQLDGFRLHPAARAEAPRAARGLARAAVERVREELDRLLESAAPERGLVALVELDLLAAVLPELVPAMSCVAGPDRPDVWTHTVATVAASTRAPRWPGTAAVLGDEEARRVLRWALLLHDVAKPDTFERRPDGRPTFHGHEVLGARRAEKILARLRMPLRERRRVERLVLQHLRPGLLADAGAPPRGLRRLVRDAGEDLPLLVLHAACDARASGGPADPARMRRLNRVSRTLLELHDARRSRPRPRLVDGATLLEALDLEPGPLIGQLLRAIEDAQDEGRVSTTDQALVFAREQLRRPSPDTGP